MTPPLVDLLRQPAVVYMDTLKVEHVSNFAGWVPCHNLVFRKIHYTPAVKK